MSPRARSPRVAPLAPRPAILLAVAAIAACRSEPPDATPEGVARALVGGMQRVHGDPAHARAAFDLLAADARKNLAERARRASAVSGRTVAPEEMIAPSQFALRFEPRRYSARREGDRAVVTVTGAAPADQRAELACVLEGGVWRVALELPELPAIERRRDADTTRR